MPERKTYARRSDLHKKPNNNQNEQRQLKKDRKDHPRERSRIEKQFFLIRLIIDRFDRDGWLSPYTLHQQEVAAQEKYEAAAEKLLASIQAEQSQNGLKQRLKCSPKAQPKN